MVRLKKSYRIAYWAKLLFRLTKIYWKNLIYTSAFFFFLGFTIEILEDFRDYYDYEFFKFYILTAKYTPFIVGLLIAAFTVLVKLSSAESRKIIFLKKVIHCHHIDSSKFDLIIVNEVNNSGKNPIRYIDEVKDGYFSEPSLVDKSIKLINNNNYSLSLKGGSKSNQNHFASKQSNEVILVSSKIEIDPPLKSGSTIKYIYHHKTIDAVKDAFDLESGSLFSWIEQEECFNLEIILQAPPGYYVHFFETDVSDENGQTVKSELNRLNEPSYVGTKEILNWNIPYPFSDLRYSFRYKLINY